MVSINQVIQSAHRIIFTFAIVFLSSPGVFPIPAAANFSQLSLYPNIETIGVAVSGLDLPETAELMVRQSENAPWQKGHPLTRINDGRLIGSLFGLSPSTQYFVKVSDGINEIQGSITTQPAELQFAPSTIIYVDDDTSEGGNGSADAPFRTIQEGINHATPGTRVLVADGVYHEAITFPSSGTSSQWIQVKAAGNGAVLDGSKSLSGGNWNVLSGVSNVWFIKGTGKIGYLSRDKKRFYNYDDITSLKQSRGHGKVTITEGWFYDTRNARLYVRSIDDPANHDWQVPSLNQAFNVDSRDWIWIEGFEIRYYGTQSGGCGICTSNVSHLVIRKNKIHNMQLGIFIDWNGTDEQGNDTRIESNEIFDPPVNEWPWKAVKGTSMEGTGIVLRGHIGAIVRGNEIYRFFNGIYTGSSAALEDPEVAFDADIYNNYIHHISDDGLEPEGACINQRFRKNRVDRMLVGISIGPVTQGPTWVVRNLFTNFTGTSIKWARDPDGIVLIYHNTSWTNAAGLDAMSTITPMHNTVMRNNIFMGNGFSFKSVVTGATDNDWNYDNWYTTLSPGGPRFRWENKTYQGMSQLCSATGLECNGHEDSPGFFNPSGRDFRLRPTSPNIDRGILIPGINDNFLGSAPDLGVYEFGSGR